MSYRSYAARFSSEGDPSQQRVCRDQSDNQGHSQHIQSPSARRLQQPHHDVEGEQDVPLDEFDRKLLAEESWDRPWVPTQTLAGLTVLQQHTQGPPLLPQFVPGGPYAEAVPVNTLPSLDRSPLSSPTVSVLHKKQQAAQYPRPSQPEVVSKNNIAEYHKEEVKSALQLDCQAWNAAPTLPQRVAGPEVRGISLVPTSRLPDKQRSLFQFPVFNAVQSKCFLTAYESDDNLVVSAPTGSGKTAIMELAILRIIDQLINGQAKAVYQAPTKSLCYERFKDWQKKFGVFGLQCAEFTGDTNNSNLRNVASASIIVTTPEKWDSVTRKWKDNARLMEMIKLFLVDEVHILKDVRGATLEAIVSRMKSVDCNVRFVALSATIPNSDDIATWLTRNGKARHLPARREVFDDTFRPVQLTKYVLGHEAAYNPWAFDSALTPKLPEIVARYGRRKPTIVFCPTKESAQRTANALAQSWFNSTESRRAWNQPARIVDVEHEQLRTMLPAGVAFHHASLSLNDRKAVEQGFLDRNINIICSTSTLAVGINLPCYLVILKGTFGYSNNGLQEYSSLEVMQMLGRAGRPQFETEACAVILCQNIHLKKYETMITGKEVLESSLHQNLIEHLNAEIGIGTINSRPSAKEWLKSTFLYVRLQNNAKYYNIDPEGRYASPDDALLAWCEKDLDLLQDANLVEDRGQLKCTEYGDAMARYCVKFDTMKAFMAVPAKAKVSDVLSALVQAVEFRDLRLKSGEKTMFKEINKANETRYPIQVDLALPQHKVSLIIQAKLGGVQIEKTSKVKISPGQTRQLISDTMYVIGHCNRLVRCLDDVIVQRKDSFAMKSALELTRSLAAGVWDDTPMQLKQIPGIGDVFMRKFAAAGVKSIDALFNTEPHRIEIILSKTPTFGHDIIKKVAAFPMLHISAKEVDKKRKFQNGVDLKLRCEIGFMNDTPPLNFNRKQFNVLYLCETSSGVLIDFRRFDPKRLQNNQEIFLTAHIEEPASKLRCHVMCDDIAGTHRFVELPINCPDSWFSSKQNTLQQACSQSTIHTNASTNRNPDEFDDGDLDDSDLLAATQGSVLEDVDDIDDIMAEVDGRKNSQIPRKRSGTSQSLDRKDHYQESKRLPNGNWPCKHICKDKGLDCKHQCCKEGTKRRPSRKRRKTSDAGEYGDVREWASQNKKSANKHTIHGVAQIRGACTEKDESASDSSIQNRMNNVRPGVDIAGSAPLAASRAENIVDRSSRANLSDDACLLKTDDFKDHEWQALSDIANSIESTSNKGNVIQNYSSVPLKTALRSPNVDVQAFGRHHVAQSAPSHEVEKGVFLTDSSSPMKDLIECNASYSTNNPLNTALNDVNATIEFEGKIDGYRPRQTARAVVPAGHQQTITGDLKEESRPCRRVVEGVIVDDKIKDDRPLRETSTEQEHRLYIEGQKKHWDDLNDPFLTHENFWFIKIVSDNET